MLDLLSEAVKEHTATAFWEYVLYLELCYKILDKDKQLHMNDHELYKPYQQLSKLYSSDIFIEESDFSERMLKLINRISEIFQSKFGNGKTHLARAMTDQMQIGLQHSWAKGWGKQLLKNKPQNLRQFRASLLALSGNTSPPEFVFKIEFYATLDRALERFDYVKEELQHYMPDMAMMVQKKHEDLISEARSIGQIVPDDPTWLKRFNKSRNLAKDLVNTLRHIVEIDMRESKSEMTKVTQEGKHNTKAAKEKAVRPGPRIKHSDEKMKQVLMSFEKFKVECIDAKQAWKL